MGNQPALTVRDSQTGGNEMEYTYVVNGNATFRISIHSMSKIEDLPEYSVYRHMLSSFKFVK